MVLEGKKWSLFWKKPITFSQCCWPANYWSSQNRNVTFKKNTFYSVITIILSICCVIFQCGANSWNSSVDRKTIKQIGIETVNESSSAWRKYRCQVTCSLGYLVTSMLLSKKSTAASSTSCKDDGHWLNPFGSLAAKIGLCGKRQSLPKKSQIVWNY